MKLISIAFLVAFLASCAVPVRPIAKIVPQPDGTAIFVADPENEPQLLGGLTGLIPSPYGELVGLAGAVLTAFFGAKAHSASRRAEEHKKDADEGWAKATETNKPKENTNG